MSEAPSEIEMGGEPTAEPLPPAIDPEGEANAEQPAEAEKTQEPEQRRDSNPRRDSKPPLSEEVRKTSNAGRKSVKMADTIPPEEKLQPQPQTKPIDKKKRMSMFQEVSELPGSNNPAYTNTGGKSGKVADTLAKNLAGTLQTFFTQDEKTNDSTALKPLRRPKHVYENTFRLQAYNPFNRDRVQKVMDAILPELVDPLKYNSETANDIATKISEKIRSRVLALRFDRYKIVVMTNIGPLNRQGLHIGFRCLWDAEKDSYATCSYKNTTLFCSAVVYGIYYE